jgi:serine/threonine-protein kinase RsbT
MPEPTAMTEGVRKFLVRLSLRDESDVAAARRDARVLAHRYGLPLSSVEALATAVSEVARNVIVHARSGEIMLGIVKGAERVGIVAVARDEGPGISDIEDAMRDGYSTGVGLGLGLPGARRLVDEFELRSAPGQGTTVSLIKWVALDRLRST